MSNESNRNKNNNLDEVLSEVRRLVGEIKYGSVTLVIQDGTVVQIERQEKIRIK